MKYPSVQNKLILCSLNTDGVDLTSSEFFFCHLREPRRGPKVLFSLVKRAGRDHRGKEGWKHFTSNLPEHINWESSEGMVLCWAVFI